MKNNKIIIFSIVLLSIVAISVLIFMIMLINGKRSFSKIEFMGRVNDKLSVDEKYNTEFNNINITSSASDIYVKKSDTSDIKLVIYSDEVPKVTTTAEELNIKLDEKNRIFNFYTRISKIEIYLPEDFEKNINIKNDYGDIKIDEFPNATIEVKEDCGDVSVKSGNNVVIKNDYGDIVLDKANEADIKQSAGDVEVGIVKKINVVNNYGDINIDEVSEYLNIEEKCGDVEIEKVNLLQDSNINNNFGDIDINYTNEVYIEAKTDLGDVKIKNNYKDAKIILRLKNNCGDITVNN